MNEDAQKLMNQADEIVHHYRMGQISLQHAGADLMPVVYEWMKLVEARIEKLEGREKDVGGSE